MIKRIIWKQKNGRNICSYLFLGIFLQAIIAGSQKIVVSLLFIWGRFHDKIFEDSYSFWAEHGRLILSVGLIFTLLHDFIWFLKEGCFHCKIHTSDIFPYVHLLVVVDSRMSLIDHCFYYYHIIITITVIIVSIVLIPLLLLLLLSNSESTVANEVPKILKSRNLKVD